MVKHIRLGSAFLVPITLLSLGFLGSCKHASVPDPKGDLIRSLKGANVEGYLFSLSEEEAKTTAALTNPAVRDLIKLGKGDPGLVLRYTSVEDKRANERTVYKSEVLRHGNSLRLAVRDLATDQIVDEGTFPPPGPTCQPPGPFDSINACTEEFNCTSKGPLQCAANRTCHPQFAALTCCLKDGSIFSVHLIITPTRPLCQLLDVTPAVDVVLIAD